MYHIIVTSDKHISHNMYRQASIITFCVEQARVEQNTSIVARWLFCTHF